MISKTLVFFLVKSKYLFLVSFLDAGQLVRRVSNAEILAMNSKEVSFMPYILKINGVKITFGEGEVANSIKQVCLACPIISNKTIDLLRKLKIGFLVILEICEREFPEVHALVCLNDKFPWLARNYFIDSTPDFSQQA